VAWASGPRVKRAACTRQILSRNKQPRQQSSPEPYIPAPGTKTTRNVLHNSIHMPTKAKTSQARVKANRANAKKSTGPRSEEGKQKASQNALTHGLTADTPYDQGDFQAFQHKMLEAIAPIGPLQETLAQRLIAVMWRLNRIPTVEAQILISADPEDTDRRLVNIARYEGTLDRAMQKTIKAMGDLILLPELHDSARITHVPSPTNSAQNSFSPNSQSSIVNRKFNAPNTSGHSNRSDMSHSSDQSDFSSKIHAQSPPRPVTQHPSHVTQSGSDSSPKRHGKAPLLPVAHLPSHSTREQKLQNEPNQVQIEPKNLLQSVLSQRSSLGNKPKLQLDAR
jgi:hypothetical protein